MCTGQVFHNRKAEARPSHIPGARAIYSVEPFKKSVDVLRWNPFSRVFNDDPAPRTFLIANSHLSTFAVELNGVVHEVRQHLLQARFIGVNSRIGGYAIYEFDLARCGPGIE